MSETVAAHRWLEEVYDPAVEAIPADLEGRLSPPEISHEILEHRWYLSEGAGPGCRDHGGGQVLLRHCAAGGPAAASRRRGRP
ncbi:MAG TPA: DUF4032 domain-containing protein [Streptosporangiaceae bacterium]